MSDKIIIDLKNIVVSYDGERVLDRINLSIRDKEFVTLLGPSGCGKTTTLRIIGGFVSADEGEIYFDGKKINDLPAHKRKVNTVFQRYALFPHLNVFDNVAFGLKLQKLPKNEIQQAVRKMLEIVNLKGFERRKVNQLSGGQQQRVAIARALVTHPSMLLADEPTGALDQHTGRQIMDLFEELNEEGNTILMITHDLNVARKARRVVHIIDGELTEAEEATFA